MEFSPGARSGFILQAYDLPILTAFSDDWEFCVWPLTTDCNPNPFDVCKYHTAALDFYFTQYWPIHLLTCGRKQVIRPSDGSRMPQILSGTAILPVSHQYGLTKSRIARHLTHPHNFRCKSQNILTWPTTSLNVQRPQNLHLVPGACT
jgi:hypothetical protein